MALRRFAGMAGSGFSDTTWSRVLKGFTGLWSSTNFLRLVGKPLRGLVVLVIPPREKEITSSILSAQKLTSFKWRGPLGYRLNTMNRTTLNEELQGGLE